MYIKLLPLLLHFWLVSPRGSMEQFPPLARDPILPAVLEFREESSDSFFHAFTTSVNPSDVQFKLAPTYTLYMAARFRWVSIIH